MDNNFIIEECRATVKAVPGVHHGFVGITRHAHGELGGHIYFRKTVYVTVQVEVGKCDWTEYQFEELLKQHFRVVHGINDLVFRPEIEPVMLR